MPRSGDRPTRKQITRRQILTWALVGITGAQVVVGTAVAWVSPAGLTDLLGMPGLSALWAVAFAGVGLVIARSQPANPIGWLLLVVGALAGYMFLADQLFGYVLGPELLERSLDPESGLFPAALPLSAVLLAGTSLSAFGVLETAGLLIIFLFPDGRLLSHRWRPVVWLLILEPVPFVAANTIGVLLVRAGRMRMETVETASLATSLLLLLAAGLIFPALVLRYRRSSTEQRLQLKWVFYVAALAAAYTLLWNLGHLVLGRSPIPDAIDSLFVPLWGLLFPIAIAIAILRYRLYEIDLIINRTLVYGSLSVLLGAVYATGVVLLPQLVPLGTESDLAVAASTLAVAGLFHPVRRRIQSFVDRRFYRARYDARQTVEAFSSRLSESTDLDQLEAEFTAVVRETLAPSSVNMWLNRSPSRIDERLEAQ